MIRCLTVLALVSPLAARSGIDILVEHCTDDEAVIRVSEFRSRRTRERYRSLSLDELEKFARVAKAVLKFRRNFSLTCVRRLIDDNVSMQLDRHEENGVLPFVDLEKSQDFAVETRKCCMKFHV